MSIYAQRTDCNDPVVRVEATDLDAADRMIRALLRNKGIPPDDVTDAEGLALLRDLAVAEASRIAAARGAADGETVLWKKSEEFRKRAQELAMRVDRESLGVAVVGSGSAGYGSIPVGRG